ncbi:F-box only protein 6-like [Miscanthus floridulus]|uniref:F-box only protein 6-like n=1 Tax=Miscanthus floridulus TaxID=154761 RepID=UPI0034581277
MGEVAALRQLVGQVQELWDLYGANAHPVPRWYLLDFEHGSIKDDYCGGRSGYNSELLKIMETNQSPLRKRPRRDRNREKAPSSNKTEVMQQEIWRDFPEDLFETVIARLPVAAIFRFRTVCQKWSSLLGSDSFSHQYSEAPRELPWFYTITHENANNNVAMYDPLLKKWHHSSVPLTPTKIVIPVASVGGLVCLLDLSHRNFYICNPLMQSLKEIPPRSVQGWSRVAVGMVLNGRSSSDGYKVMWLGNDGTYEVYDSTKNMWSCPGTFPPGIKLPLALNFRSQPVAVGSTVYFMCAEPDGVLSCDVSTGIWRQFAIPLPLHLTDHTLAEFQGRVMLVGLLCKNAATCVCIWELQKMTLLWKEVDRMPNIWCLEFYGKHMKMTCLGNSGLLMLSLKAKRMNRLVTYNLLKREWQKVPDCMLPCSRKKQWIACGTAFDPVPCALA